MDRTIDVLDLTALRDSGQWSVAKIATTPSVASEQLDPTVLLGNLVRQIATRFSAAFFKGHADHGGKYDVAHSPQIFVLDKQGHLRAELYNASVEAMIGVANALVEEGG